MKRLALIAAAVVALGAPAPGGAAASLVFDRSDAAPNDRVTVRTAGTPVSFAPADRVRPLQRPLRLYLVPNEPAVQVRSRVDPRLHFVGLIVPDKRGRGLLTFSVPPLDAGTYTIASWCASCPGSTRGRVPIVQRPDRVIPRYRSQALLRVAATQSCPVTLPNASRPPRQPRTVAWYGNGVLWAGVNADGVYAVPPDRVGADGSIGDKLLWATTPPWRRPTISGERLDAPSPPLRVSGVNQGSFSSAGDPSYMSPVSFAAAGCWRLTARVEDLTLTYVVRVVVQQEGD